MHKLSIAGLSFVLLAGCAQKTPETVVVAAPEPAPVRAPAPIIIQQTAVEPKAEDAQAKSLKECRQQLETMQVYSKASYNRYQAELKKLDAAQAKYQRVKDAVGEDINSVLMPKSEFQARELCFRIKGHLMQLMVRPT